VDEFGKYTGTLLVGLVTTIFPGSVPEPEGGAGVLTVVDAGVAEFLADEAGEGILLSVGGGGGVGVLAFGSVPPGTVGGGGVGDFVSVADGTPAGFTGTLGDPGPALVSFVDPPLFKIRSIKSLPLEPVCEEANPVK
jgi:hypothetical protein